MAIGQLQGVDRRAFFAIGAASVVGASALGARPADAATSELVVYRLDADWGYPVAPKGKTRCGCRACYRRAASAYFTTEAAAIVGRIHPCCVCQPYRTTIVGVTADELFRDGDAADRRDARVAALLDRYPQPADPDGRGRLPVTGTDPRVLGGIAAALLAAGAGLLTFRERGRATVPCATDPDRLDDPNREHPTKGTTT